MDIVVKEAKHRKEMRPGMGRGNLFVTNLIAMKVLIKVKRFVSEAYLRRR